MIESPNNTVGPDEEGVANGWDISGTQGTLTDPRMRLVIVTPKRTYGKVPLDARAGGPIFPYYSESDAQFPVHLTPPLDSDL